MKVGQDYFPKSSFLSVDKDFAIIKKKILSNQRLLKMLYYTEKDCLKAKDLTPEQAQSMLHKQIKIIPHIKIDKECPINIIITMDNFVPSVGNPEFRDCNINFDILCHPDHWNMGNFQLRPYKIAGEIDAMINEQYLTGIGKTYFVTGNNLVLNDELMGISLIYHAVHGIEDQVDPLS